MWSWQISPILWGALHCLTLLVNVKCVVDPLLMLIRPLHVESVLSRFCEEFISMLITQCVCCSSKEIDEFVQCAALSILTRQNCSYNKCLCTSLYLCSIFLYECTEFQLATGIVKLEFYSPFTVNIVGVGCNRCRIGQWKVALPWLLDYGKEKLKRLNSCSYRL